MRCIRMASEAPGDELTLNHFFTEKLYKIDSTCLLYTSRTGSAAFFILVIVFRIKNRGLIRFLSQWARLG